MLKKIIIENFRNFENVNLSFTSGYNLIIGENGQGKTNLLEAIYFASLLRSFRTHIIENLKNYNTKKSHFFINLLLENNKEKNKSTPLNLKIGYAEKKVTKINEIVIKKASDFINQFICIVFAPEDIELITDSGKERRKFIDITISQLNKNYLFALQNYSLALKNRNALLKQVPINKQIINSFDQILIENGAIIYNFRLEFFKKLNLIILQKNKLFYEKNYKFSIIFNSAIGLFSLEEVKSIELIKTKFKKILEKNLPRDIETKTTNYGPHRDDFSIFLETKKIKDFGSRGQSRLAALLLKIAVTELILDQENLENKSIIFLVDDVTGELDIFTKDIFFSILEKGTQVFFATTEIPDFFAKKVATNSDIKIFIIKNGQISIN